MLLKNLSCTKKHSNMSIMPTGMHLPMVPTLVIPFHHFLPKSNPFTHTKYHHNKRGKSNPIQSNQITITNSIKRAKQQDNRSPIQITKQTKISISNSQNTQSTISRLSLEKTHTSTKTHTPVREGHPYLL